MSLSKQHGLMLLFVSLKNPLWRRILKPEERIQETIRTIIGVAYGTISNWRKGKEISWVKAGGVFEGTRRRILQAVKDKGEADKLTKIVDAFSKLYFSNEDVSLHDAAQLLSMPIEQYQKLIDEAVYNRRPVFADMYYETSRDGRAAAREDYRRYRGFYHAWMRRGLLWLRSPLHVRYVLKIHDGLAIRCKMSLPVIEPEPQETYYDYDGFLVVRDLKLFWMLQKREPRRNDFVYFITCAGRPCNGQLTMAGEYLTTGQDANQSIVSSDVLMQRIVIDSVDDIYKRVDDDAAVFDAADSKAIGQLWKEFTAESKPSKTQKTKKTYTKKRQPHNNQGIDKIGKTPH